MLHLVLVSYLVVYIVFIMLFEFNVYPKIKLLTINKEIHEKYPAFRRKDANLMVNRFHTWFMIILMPLRVVPIVSLSIGLGFFGFIVSKFSSEGNFSENSGCLYWIKRIVVSIFSRLLLFWLSGVWWIRMYSPKVDYKKYLGPDWKLDENLNPTSIVANHQAFQDVFFHMMFYSADFIMKVEALKVPFVPNIAKLGH